MKSKDQKRAEALIRKELHDKLPVTDKLYKTSTKRGASKREAERLLKLLS